MKSNVEKLLELELQYKNGIAYIVTTKWYALEFIYRWE
jgi:hypothetical protein